MRIVTLKMGEQGVKIFSQLAPLFIGSSPLHSHQYPEIHVFLSGCGEYTVEGVPYSLSAGDAILIPAARLHATATEEGSRVFVLQADLSADAVRRLVLPAPMLDTLSGAEGDAPEMTVPVLSYLVASLSPRDLYTVSNNDDYAYLVHEYVEQNYHRPLRLADLAAELHLSERQTQRIITRLFGMSFSELLSRHRASVATRLAATTDMPWSEIAAYVGYETYSGFRRSFRRHKGEE